ncbi:MAG: helicase HerA-like domain-containing protein, partial [Isosphaeraceae bacterium]
MRKTFAHLVNRVCEPAALPSGRIMLLLGDSGSGKTHLMRAFRNQVHSSRRGYCGYMQMTAFTSQYGRYVLNNLIESLDKPYYEPESSGTGLMRLSTTLARSIAVDDSGKAGLDQLREEELDQKTLDHIVGDLADRIILDDRFKTIDVYLTQALLYLQYDDPRIKARVLKYLRCEDLTPHDRQLLGGIVPCTYPDAPHWVIQRLGELMWALEGVPLILCVDQLEDMFDMEDAPTRFRRSLATLCDIVSRLPSTIVVISCLQDYYAKLKEYLIKPTQDRIQGSRGPINLEAPRESHEIAQMIAQRLKFLYQSANLPLNEDDPTYPLPPALVRRLAGMRTRDVLNACQVYRDRCVAEGRLVPYPFDGEITSPKEQDNTIEQAWNEHHTTVSLVVPTEEPELARVLCGAIGACSGELETGHEFLAEADGRFVPVEIHDRDDSVERLLIGVCNKRAQGGGLGRQIEDLVKRAGEHTVVVVRSTAYPSNPKTVVAQLLDKLITGGGRRVVVEDSDWRTMLAFESFRENHGAAATFAAWQTQTRPLTSLDSLRAILDLDRLTRASSSAGPRTQGSTKPGARPTDLRLAPASSVAPGSASTTEPSVSSSPSVALVVGTTTDRRAEKVSLSAGELTRHAAFIGAPGSGKTTVALGLIEQLLLQGIPAILIDRKGDLCAYARPGMSIRDELDGPLAERAEQLRRNVEIALYTPRRSDGRPLSIAAVPAGLGALPDLERRQAARFAASALAGMMNYSNRKPDQSLLAILGRAIDLVSQEHPQDPVPIESLLSFIADQDTSLVNEVGRLDVKLFDKLVQDLETLRLNHGDLLAARGEPLEIEALFGLGRHARPGKTRLSIISTKFLGGSQDVQFWIAQFVMEVGRWISRAPAPDGTLQA